MALLASAVSATAATLDVDVLSDPGADRAVKILPTKGRTSQEAATYVADAKTLALKFYGAAYDVFSDGSFKLRDLAASYYEGDEDDTSIPGHGKVNPITQSDRALIDGLRTSLRSAEVLAPKDDEDFDGCHRDKGILAFVKKHYDGRIYVCHHLAYSSRPLEYAAQTLVHEAVHTTGIHDECVTTQVEVAVMRETDSGQIYRNGYWSLCGMKNGR